MPQLIIDPMDHAGNWPAFEPDGATASAEIAMADEATHVRYGADKRSGRLSASTAALDHTVRRTLPALDLTSFPEIRLWLKSSRVADGSTGRPFYLEVRLASAGMGLADPGNTWRRFLPACRADTWELVRLSLDDLAPAVRSAVSSMEIRCADASVSFVCFLDDLLAVREEMIGDVDAALLALLHERLTVNGTKVPAVISHPENPPALALPSIRITLYDVQYARERTTLDRPRSDYSGMGFRLRPAPIHYDLYYRIDAYGDTRPQKTQVLEFLLRTLSPRVELVANGMPLTLEWVTIDPLDGRGQWRSDREMLYFKVATRQEVGTFEPVKPPYASITLVSDPMTVG